MKETKQYCKTAIGAAALLTILTSPPLYAAPSLIYEGIATIEAIIPEKRMLIVFDTPVALDASTEIIDANGQPLALDQLTPGMKAKIYYPGNREHNGGFPRKIVIEAD